MCRLFLARYLTFNIKMFKLLHDRCVVEQQSILQIVQNDLHCIVLEKEVRTCNENVSYSFIGNSLW